MLAQHPAVADVAVRRQAGPDLGRGRARGHHPVHRTRPPRRRRSRPGAGTASRTSSAPSRSSSPTSCRARPPARCSSASCAHSSPHSRSRPSSRARCSHDGAGHSWSTRAVDRIAQRVARPPPSARSRVPPRQPGSALYSSPKGTATPSRSVIRSSPRPARSGWAPPSPTLRSGRRYWPPRPPRSSIRLPRAGSCSAWAWRTT